MISFHMKNMLIMPNIALAQTLSPVWLLDVGVWIVDEFADHLISLLTLALPLSCQLLTSCGKKIDKL